MSTVINSWKIFEAELLYKNTFIMAKAEFIKSARKNIYAHGKRVELIHQKGKNSGQKYIKLDRTQPENEKDEILIHKGESYWTWCFMNQSPHYSKTRPRQSQLTQSAFYSEYYSIQEEIEDFSPESSLDIPDFIDGIISRLEDLRDQCQESLDNMPDSLQDSDTGQMLQERIDECDNLISDFESLDTEYSSDEEVSDDSDSEEMSDEEQEWLDGVLSEIQGICFNL